MTDDAHKMLEQRWRAPRGGRSWNTTGERNTGEEELLWGCSQFLIISAHLLDATTVGGMKGTTVVWQE